MTSEQDISALCAYVSEQLKAGYTKEQLNVVLVQSGWNQDDIEEVFSKLLPVPPPIAVSPSTSGETHLEQHTQEKTTSPDALDPSALVEAKPAATTPSDSVSVDSLTPASSSNAPSVPKETPLSALSQHSVPPVASEAEGAKIKDVEKPETPSVNPVSPEIMEQDTTHSDRSRVFKILTFVGIGVLVLGVVSAFGYLFVAKKGPFAPRAPYTETNILTGLALRVGEITEARTRFSLAMAMEPREEGAVSFATPEVTEWVSMIDRDTKRMMHARKIALSATMFRFADLRSASSAYPKTLNDLDDISISELRDPRSGAPYAYKPTENGQNFELTVTFESEKYVAGYVKIWNEFSKTPLPEGAVVGTTITFTKDVTPQNILPPKPSFLALMAKSSQYLPPELSAHMGVAFLVAKQTSSSTIPDLDVSFDTDLELGDMSYKLAADLRKVDENFYLRVRNIPGIILSLMPFPKNTWVVVTPHDIANASTTPNDLATAFLSGFVEGFANAAAAQSTSTPTAPSSLEEDEGKEAREALRAALLYAAEERLVRFRTEPTMVLENEKTLFQYDLLLDRDVFVKVLDRLFSDPLLTKDMDEEDKTKVLEFIHGDEYAGIFDAFATNTSYILYVDEQGFPVRFEMSMRIVPPDTAEQLAGKQLRFTLSFGLDEINTPVAIEVPADARPMSEMWKEEESSTSTTTHSGLLDRAQLGASVLMSAAGYPYPDQE